MNSAPAYLIAVDGGGTHCRVRLCDRGGRQLASSRGGAANINTDFQAARANIEAAVAEAYEAAGLDAARMAQDVAYLGLAGAGVGDGASRLEAALGFHRVIVTTDREITVQGALAGEDGTVALIGTGSFFQSRAKGRERRIGGWGLILGDECGGANLGRELLRRTIRAEDGLIEHSELTRDVLARFAGKPSDIVGFAQRAKPADFGRFAPEIVEADGAGDPVAGAIMAEAVAVLNHVLEVIGARENGPICFLGGMGEVYRARVDPTYQALAIAARGDGLSGAIDLAKRSFFEKEGAR